MNKVNSDQLDQGPPEQQPQQPQQPPPQDNTAFKAKLGTIAVLGTAAVALNYFVGGAISYAINKRQ